MRVKGEEYLLNSMDYGFKNHAKQSGTYMLIKEIVNCVCWHLIPFTIQTKKVKEIVSFR